MRNLVLVLAVIAACGAPAKEPAPWRHAPTFHITRAADVRWPVARSLFVGMVHDGRLRLDDDLAGPVAHPRLVAVGREIANGRVAVSGIGRPVTRDEAAAGAVIALAVVHRESDIAAPHVMGYPVVRRDSDLSVALAQTYVTAEGIVRAHSGGFVLELPSHDELPLLVAACEGEVDARAQVGKQRRVYGTLTADRVLAISMPTFEDQ
jgi:hypothetical protein